MTHTRAVVPFAVAALIPGLLVLAGVLDGLGTDERIPIWAAVLLAVGLLTPAAVGLVILRRGPRNLIGWILLVGPVPIAVMACLEVYARARGTDGAFLPGNDVAGILSVALWPTFYVWPLAIAFVFPDGHLPSRRWRWPAVAVFTAAGLVIAFVLVGEERLDPAMGGGANPFRVEGVDVLLPLFWAIWGVLLAGLFLGAAAVVVRYRRARGVERLQLKWLAWSAGLIPLGLLVCALSYLLVGDVTILVPAVLVGAGVCMSVSVGIAVTRHGLYEIDRLVNRTLVYAVLTLALGAVFVVIVVVSGIALGRGSMVGTALATLVVALAAAPLRGRVQRGVDRRFARARYEGLSRVRAFEDAVRRGAEEPEGVEQALRDALGDDSLRLWLRLARSERHADVQGAIVDRAAPAQASRTIVEHHGDEIAIIVHAPLLLTRPDLLRSVVDAATLPIELARLRAEVRVQLAEVEASRERLIRAGDDERRRLERDLHDGAQQRLVSLGVSLRRMQRSLPREARALVPAFDQAVDEVGQAIADLRTIAAGLRPPRLDDGLAAALGDLARSAPVPVVVRVEVDDLPPPVELVAYYTVCEAITNAVKHASATRVDVEALIEGDHLTVRVRDDGRGGAVARGASGLAGIADRVGAQGGRLHIDSPAGAGTLLEAELPCAS